MDFCASNPCKNNGNCSIYEGPNFATYQCDCLDGFIGAHCELNVDECEENPCKHGRCIDGIGGFRCDCHPGEYNFTIIVINILLLNASWWVVTYLMLYCWLDVTEGS